MENETENKPQGDIGNEDDRQLTKRERRLLAKQKKSEERSKQGRTAEAKKWIFRTIVLLLVVLGVYKAWQWINTPGEGGRVPEEILSVKSDDWVKGNSNAKITLVEYADFECPACRIYSSEILPKLTEEFKDDLKIVSRHYPLPQHTKAVDAAKAVEAAGSQNKFWEMYELLYDKQDDWSGSGNAKDKFREYAASLGLNIARYDEDFKSDNTAQSIKKDEADGLSLRIDSTPTFYVNGKKVISNNGYNDLKKAIDDALIQLENKQ